jgi:Subtilase family
MSSPSTGPRILVKARPGLPASALAVGETRIGFSVEPLFSSIDAGGQGVAAAATWQLLTPDAETDINPWDACHALLQQGLGVSGGGVEFAEPDLAQRWRAGDERGLGMKLAKSCGESDPQNKGYPVGPSPYWIRDVAHSQFDDALANAGAPTMATRVRVTHLDTGYSDHETKPRFLNPVLQRNFVDPDRPGDATDVSPSGFTNPGHGTGTLGILAGKAIGAGAPLGCAPNAEVVPVRVASSVVLFYNSAIARAFDYVHQLGRNPATRVDVITMSMGGLASQAWADAVNALYEQGVFIVTAAGNNYGNVPTHHIVFPARFNRVVAACGVMADHTPYADLEPFLMAGNYGPDDKMATAISASTPNTPWARMGCPSLIDFDGSGTSSATPQVAAASALWIQANRAAVDAYPQGWMRVEAIRKALFQSAAANAKEKRRLGWGELKARAALVSEAQRRMMQVEALQLSQSAAVEAVLAGVSRPEQLTAKDKLDLADALLSRPGISTALKSALQTASRTARQAPKATPRQTNAVEEFHLSWALDPPIAAPPRRRLRVFALDPSMATDVSTAAINVAVIDVRWEADLRPGPVGEYVEIVDVDPASRCVYAPVDLNHPHLLPQDGFAPSEANPQFHQQMCYAVTMRTIEYFEHALGRVALWAPHRVKDKDGTSHPQYVQRLRVYPHAIRAENAFYSPDRKALLLGYFTAPGQSAGLGLPHGVVFGALSHDVVAHETTHALLDGLHRRFREPTNPDVLAFHEAFADIVALFQHFTLPEALLHQIRKTRGDIGQQNLLAELAVEFGQAMSGSYAALRNEIETAPSRSDYTNNEEPHARGSVLVSAVFAAFLAIYRARTADLIRLATNGTGVLPAGDISVDLASRMADEASNVASQVLRMCIRALDYCPPIDITFGDYLRALITADRDLVPDDPRNYRVAFVAAFRDRGIYPAGVRHLSPGNLVWEPPPLPLKNLKSILSRLALTWGLDGDRRLAYETARNNAAIFHKWLLDPNHVSDDELAALGFEREPGPRVIAELTGDLHGIEVHSVRPARRIGPDGQSRTDLVIEITQTFYATQGGAYRGGCTLLIDLEISEVRYFVRKRLTSPDLVPAQLKYRLAMSENLRAAYFDEPLGGREPFALLHNHR